MIDRHLINLSIALQHIDPDVPTLQEWGRKAAAALTTGNRLFACGVGASAEQARQLVSELARPDDDRPPLAAATLPAESASPAASSARRPATTADPGAEISLAGTDCHPGDVLLCLSATAADEHTAAAAAAAGEAGMKTWALTGQAPNAVAGVCEEAVCVDAAARSTIEEVHVAAIHIFCAAVNSAVRDAIRAGQVSAKNSQPASA